MSSFKNTRCSGCYPIFQPNQQAHQGFGGCMEIKYDFEELEEEEDINISPILYSLEEPKQVFCEFTEKNVEELEEGEVDEEQDEEQDEKQEQGKEIKEEEDPAKHSYFYKPAFVKRFKGIPSYDKEKVFEVIVDLLKEQPDIAFPCLLGMIDKIINPSISYSDISAGTYMKSVELWNCFIMNSYIEWQKNGGNGSGKIYSFHLLISHRHLVF